MNLRAASPSGILAAALVASLGAFVACSNTKKETGTTPVGSDVGSSDASAASRYLLASVVLGESGRTTYVQVLSTIPEDHVTNEKAIEIPGNGVVLTRGNRIYVGLAEEPTWVRYSVAADGTIRESGRVSFLNLGLARIDFGNAIVDDHTAVSASSGTLEAVVWDPEDMVIRGTVALPHLAKPGYALEVFTTVAHDGLVYIPGRWANWDNGDIVPQVTVTIVDPTQLSIKGVAEDTRCASGGRAIFDRAGNAYVMGDGRNYSLQMYANAAGKPAPKNCILRIPTGTYAFDPTYYQEVTAFTGGLESVTELDTAEQGSGVAFTKLFYPQALPAGVTATTFDFWSKPVFKAWRIELGDTPTAKAIDGAPMATLGFDGSSAGGKMYTGESPSYATSEVYEVDPVANTAVKRFTMDGIFYGLLPLK